MIYPVYSVRDKLAGFGQPEVSLNEATMVRAFSQRINTNSVLEYSPSDYDLYKIGTFNVDTGEFKAIMPEFVRAGLDVYGEHK